MDRAEFAAPNQDPAVTAWRDAVRDSANKGYAWRTRLASVATDEVVAALGVREQRLSDAVRPTASLVRPQQQVGRVLRSLVEDGGSVPIGFSATGEYTQGGPALEGEPILRLPLAEAINRGLLPPANPDVVQPQGHPVIEGTATEVTNDLTTGAPPRQEGEN